MKNSSIRIISFMAIAIAINYIGANIALFLRLPIYLDMIGTLLVAVVFGPWLGAGAAIVSALISLMTTDIFAFFFFNDTATTEIYTLSLHELFRSADQNGTLRALVNTSKDELTNAQIGRAHV